MLEKVNRFLDAVSTARSLVAPTPLKRWRTPNSVYSRSKGRHRTFTNSHSGAARTKGDCTHTQIETDEPICFKSYQGAQTLAGETCEIIPHKILLMHIDLTCGNKA